MRRRVKKRQQQRTARQRKLRPPRVGERRPKVTVTLGSNRPGGIDISLAGLAHQTFTDFEVVFTDGLYHTRHAQVLAAVKRSGLKQPFFHVPNHRYRSDVWGSTCAGYNTGFALAAGEIVVMLLDYAYAPPHWLAEHVKHQDASAKLIMAPHQYRTLHDVVIDGDEPCVAFDRAVVDSAPAERVIEVALAQRKRFGTISIFDEPFKPEQLDKFPPETSDVKCGMTTGPSDYGYFHTKNESFPLEAVLDANGMDENYDRGRGPGDPDLALRLTRTGLAPWIVHEAMVFCLNPRAIMPNINLVIPENSRLPPPYDARWCYADGCAHFEQAKASGIVRAPNPFDLREKREAIWRWRELSRKRDPVIPKTVIADQDYY